MRRNPTPSERVLWRALRAKAIDGLKFRRQEIIGRYIVDLYCSAAKLVVEVDGATHAESATDPTRDAWLATQGIQVFRVWNNDVLSNLDGVLRVIAERAAARLAPPPNPLPQGEGEPFSSPPPLEGLGREADQGRGEGAAPGTRK